ncbi:MAG: winged helix-turn-helix domain-containing protein [Candidatus Geothermarchaeales archaeon]
MSEKSRTRDLFYVYSILSHPIRREIVEMLGDRGKVSFTEIKRSSKIRVGTLYYHFDVLKGFITQDEERLYMLTDLGRDAYQMLSSEEYQRVSAKAAAHLPPKPLPRPLRYFKNIFLPSDLIQAIYGNPRLGGVIAMFLIGFGLWITVQSRLEPLMLFFDPTRKPPFLIGIQFILSWLLIFALSDLLSIALFKRKGDDLYLLIGTAYALLPLLTLPTLWYVNDTFNLGLYIFKNASIARGLLALLQGWTLAVLSCVISQSKGLKIDKSATIGLIVAYLNIAAIYVFRDLT